MQIHRQTSRVTETTKTPIATTESFAESSAPKASDFDLQDLYLVLQSDPYNSPIALELGRRLSARGDSQQAISVLRAVLKIDHGFHSLSALGLAEYQADQLDSAFEHLQQALLVAEDSEPELFDIFKTLGNIFTRRGDLDSAEDSYNKAYRLNPDSDSLAVNLGTLSIQKQRWDEATERFREALRMNPRNDKAWLGLALCHRTKGDWELAWGNLEAALEANPRNEVGLGLSLEWGSQEGREFRALELLRRFLVHGGWNEKLSLAFAWLSWRRGDSLRARLELERVLAVDPNHVAAVELLQTLRSKQ